MALCCQRVVVTDYPLFLQFAVATLRDLFPVTGTNQQAAELIPISAQQKADAMQLGYAQPFSFRIGPRPETRVSSVRHGVTEITLGDGRLVRATLHVKSVKEDPRKPGAIDISYNVVTEVMAKPDSPILDVHETVQ
jgi:hypothetical protein